MSLGHMYRLSDVTVSAVNQHCTLAQKFPLVGRSINFLFCTQNSLTVFQWELVIFLYRSSSIYILSQLQHSLLPNSAFLNAIKTTYFAKTPHSVYMTSALLSLKCLQHFHTVSDVEIRKSIWLVKGPFQQPKIFPLKYFLWEWLWETFWGPT